MGLSFPAPAVPPLPSPCGLPRSRDAGSAAAWFDEGAGAAPRRDTGGEALDMRQLRHHTKNALQRILGVLMATPPGAGDEWVEDVGRRVRLSAEVSNALFGLTQAPGPMQGRLEALAGAVVALMSAPGQVVEVQVLVSGDCPPTLRGGVIQVAHEFIGNAIKHGFRARAHGTLRVALSCRPGSHIRLLVSDDGHGPDAGAAPGEGMGIASALAGRMGGTVALHRKGVTEAELLVPARLGDWAVRGGHARG